MYMSFFSPDTYNESSVERSFKRDLKPSGCFLIAWVPQMVSTSTSNHLQTLEAPIIIQDLSVKIKSRFSVVLMAQQLMPTTISSMLMLWYKKDCQMEEYLASQTSKLAWTEACWMSPLQSRYQAVTYHKHLWVMKHSLSETTWWSHSPSEIWTMERIFNYRLSKGKAYSWKRIWNFAQ